MPTYQYACTDCADRLEVVQKFTDDSLTVCPACGGRLRKIFSPVGIVFKGSGFYRTDSRSSQKSTEPAASSNGSDGKKADSAASSDSSSSSSSGDKSGTGDKKSGEKVSSSPSPESSSSKSSSSGSKVA